MKEMIYKTPLTSRYTDIAMQEMFGDMFKFTTWRMLWYTMARCQCELGAPVTSVQVEELAAQIPVTEEEILEAANLEKQIRHDVMAHVAVYGKKCPAAAPIIHLGCTSMYVCDNTDLIIMHKALGMISEQIARCLERMSNHARKYANLPTLGWTHLQPAQPTTVGKRIACWMQDLLFDAEQISFLQKNLKFLGAKGATGTQDSYLKLFAGDVAKVVSLDRMVTQACGFKYDPFFLCGQTYTRKLDSLVLSALGNLASSVHKMLLDLRILQNMKEIEEPFEKSQVGSSAMPYKRNPMRSERANGLARHSMVLPVEALMTHALQIFERTLDDSAPRRIYIPEAFLTANAILLIVQNVFENLVVYPKMIAKHLAAEMSFMASEEIIDALVKTGKNRAECHESLRQIANEAGRQIKEEGRDNPFLDLVRLDPLLSGSLSVVDSALDPLRYIGRAPNQVYEFLDYRVGPFLTAYGGVLAGSSELRV